mmetsp:Transcript_72745/g.206447  ORF Transcript_72745/g.206447 Transcript_72745/m.206447 type:complete len:255 (+) Transcript_72745:306-1070(+)
MPMLPALAVQRGMRCIAARPCGAACSPAAGPAAPEVHGRVVHEVPDPLPDEAVLALVDLGGLDDLLLQRGGQAPVHHVPGPLLLVGGQHEAGVVRAEARREHAGAPGPPRVHELHLASALLGLFHGLDVLHGVQRLLLAWVGDLGDRRHLEVGRVADAAQVAVAHGVDAAVAPGLAGVAGRGLVHDLQLLVEVDPAAAAGALVAEDLLGHEVVRGLDADADVGLRRAPREVDLGPELVTLGVVLGVVELLDLDL